MRSHTPGSIDRAGSTLPTIFALFTLLFDDFDYRLRDLLCLDGEDFPFVDREADRGSSAAGSGGVIRDTVEPVSCVQELALQLLERDLTGHDDASPDKPRPAYSVERTMVPAKLRLYARRRSTLGNPTHDLLTEPVLLLVLPALSYH